MSSTRISTVPFSLTSYHPISDDPTRTTLSWALKRMETPTVFGVPAVTAPAAPQQQELPSWAIAATAVTACLGILMTCGVVFCFCTKFGRRRRGAEPGEEEAAEAGGSSSASPRHPGSGSLEGIQDDIPVRQVPSHSSLHSHTSRAGRTSYSQPPRGARHAGATGMANGLSSMSGGGGGGGGGSHH
ncbi:hypothetical protein GGR53DRAFT_510966 [Hypoxylon sp. FL1150]|nr:hypothetical protein GGR53DRAFT_510966 [Hypoxylon sp. FL1150]